jgi:type IV pilus assembly protein PilA
MTKMQRIDLPSDGLRRRVRTFLERFSYCYGRNEIGEEQLSLAESCVHGIFPEYTHRRTALGEESGFTLMELLIVMSIMIILMLIAIPNFISMTAQANETSAMQSLRAIYQSQIQYQINYPANGFACSLASLGGNSTAGPPSPQAAQLLQGNLASGQKSGYTFNITNCTKVNVNNQDMYTSYEATAVPQSVGKTGHRGFCIDIKGELTSDPAGGTNCTQAVQ